MLDVVTALSEVFHSLNRILIDYCSISSLGIANSIIHSNYLPIIFNPSEIIL